MRSRASFRACPAAIMLACAAGATASPTVTVTSVFTGGQNITAVVPGSLSPSWTAAGIDSLAVNNSGHWALGTSSGGSPNRALVMINTADSRAVLSEHWATGQLQDLPGLGPVAQRGLHGVQMNNADHVIRNLRMTSGIVVGDTYGGANGNSVSNIAAIYLDTRFVLRGAGSYGYTGPNPVPAPTSPLQSFFYLGDPCLPAASFPAGATWGKSMTSATSSQWNDDCAVSINDSNQVFMIAQYVDPAFPTLVQQGAVRLNLTASGSITSTDFLARTGSPISGAGVNIATISTGAAASGEQIYHSSINNSGQCIYSVQADDGFSSFILVNDTAIVRNGDPTPIPGVSFGAVYAAPIDINNHGDWVIRAPLSDGSVAIIKSINGVQSVVARTGDAAPNISGGFPLTDIGPSRGRIQISDSGQVLWWGRFTAPTSNVALFLDDQPIVRQGITTRADNSVIGSATALTTPLPTTAPTGTLAYLPAQLNMSRNGQWVIFRVTGAGSATSANLVHICPDTDLTCNPSAGACCSGSICILATAATCAATNQSFAGPGIPCTPYSSSVPCCRADYNHTGGAPTVQDIFDFLAGYFNASPTADFNESGAVTVQDIFDFLSGYFSGCP